MTTAEQSKQEVLPDAEPDSVAPGVPKEDTTNPGDAPRPFLDIATRHEKTLVLGALVVALLLRFLHLVQIRANDPFFANLSVDPKVYHTWATRISGGDWVGEGTFFLSPLYPYFLGSLYWLFGGPDLVLVRMVQCLLGSLGVLLVHAIGKRLFDVRVGILAAFLHATYVMNIFYDGMLLVAPLQAPLNLLAVFLLLQAADKRGWWRWLLAGCTLGLSAVARPNMLLFIAVSVFYVLYVLRPVLEKRARLLGAGLVLMGATLAVAPVTIRNLVVAGDFTLVSGQSGVNLYIGNGNGAIGTFRVPDIFALATRADSPDEQAESYRNYAEKASGRTLTPTEVSSFYTKLTVNEMLASPGKTLALLLRKAGLFINCYEVGNSQDFYMSRAFSWVMRAPLPSASFAFSFGVVGFAMALRRWRETFLVTSLVGVYAFTLIAYFVLAHYRMPVIPVILVLAASAVVGFMDRLAQGRYRPLVPWVAGLGVTGVLVCMKLVDPSLSEYANQFNLGNKYREGGRPAEAKVAYEASIRARPTYISSHNNLAITCEMLNDRDCAVREWSNVRFLGRQAGDQAYVDRAETRLRRLGVTDSKGGSSRSGANPSSDPKP